MKLWTRPCLPWLLLAALVSPFAAAGQSLAEVARESKKKKEESTRKVWTNDELGIAFPAIKLLGKAGKPVWLGDYDPTPLPIVETMLRLADVQPGEVVFDLGSGDGRIVILAAERFGARGVGIEIDEKLVEESSRLVEAKGLQDDVKIIHADAFDVDLRPADVVTLYVESPSLEPLRKHMEATMRLGARVVSNYFEIPGWTPLRVYPMAETTLYLYVVR